MTVEQTIPVVNLADYDSDDPEVREAFVKKFGEGLNDLGFVAVEGHGVPQELIDRNYELFEEFFALDEETKGKYEQPDSGRQRGYTPFGMEHAKDNEKPDLKEFWHVGREFDADSPLAKRMPQNVWPDELPAFRDNTLALYDALEASAHKMLAAISEYLGQPKDFIPSKAQDGNSIIRIIHYPVCDGFDEPGQMRAAEHEDINLITLLPAATDSGLEILTRDGEWLPVPSLEGQLIVDTGDMMKRLTNDVIPATTHRVVNPEGEPEPRYSMPFFVHPHPDASLEVIADCVPEGEEPKYEPTTADEYLQERLRAIGVA
ncbi:isopenicillin N synthase family oxygenase [Persicimonas caeni]|uniref:Isopenicillin N synthase family oxygenase n=1 Tax=Persicimonas caeni TaxID=2292766 RepID=A0A4Y6PVH8_PERCE|nr:2-oxoglutarate and iron-dependent oxygenase domain-containing protein [Persicimonas caeni]QDG52346.1 isopenicillin N synthase family oxygenase [Persicimonas caeni]QED33568.1 isopenicillin N synthase family oxygenase [Persicimonas caeni]